MADAEGKRWEWTERKQRELQDIENEERWGTIHAVDTRFLCESLRAALGEIENLNQRLAAMDEAYRCAAGDAEERCRENERLRGEVERARLDGALTAVLVAEQRCRAVLAAMVDEAHAAIERDERG